MVLDVPDWWTWDLPGGMPRVSAGTGPSMILGWGPFGIDAFRMSLRTAIVTICSNNYLPQAEVLFASVRMFHPDADLILGLADQYDVEERYPDGVEVIPSDRLGIPDFASFAFSYDVMEFNTAIKPYLMLRLFERGYDNVIFFDPDIEIYRRLDDVLGLLDGGASFVLTPHFCAPPHPDASRTEQHVMQTGVYNLGFLAASQRPETEPTLRWWARKLRYDCRNDQTLGLFVDQKYMDLLPGLTEHTCVLRDPSLNVAYWNLPPRRLSGCSAAGWRVDDRPLGFFHFSGFDPERPDRLSRYVPLPLATGALAGLLAGYAARRLAAASPRAGASRPYAYGRFASGVAIPELVRRMFREKHLTWSGDPFLSYDRYARLPNPSARTGTLGERVTNLMQHVHARSGELRFAFHLDNPFEVSAFARFFARDAAARGIDESLWRVAGSLDVEP